MPKPNDIKFDSKRHKQNDDVAKDVAKEILEQLEFTNIRENEKESQGDFSEIWDIGGDFNGKQILIEAEIKRDWGTKWAKFPFKWGTVDIPYRKRNKTKVQSTHMLVISGSLDMAFLVSRENMLSSSISNKDCRNREEKEPFFNIALIDGTFLAKKNGVWGKITYGDDPPK